MSNHYSCTRWAAGQTCGSPEAKLILMLIAHETDAGASEVSVANIAFRAELSDGSELRRALLALAQRGLIEKVGHDQGFLTYAPKGWLQ